MAELEVRTGSTVAGAAQVQPSNEGVAQQSTAASTEEAVYLSVDLNTGEATRLIADPSQVRGGGAYGFSAELILGLAAGQVSPPMPDICNHPATNTAGTVVVKLSKEKAEGDFASFKNIDKFPIIEACTKIPDGIPLDKLWAAVREYENFHKFVDPFTWGKVHGARNPKKENVTHEFNSDTVGGKFHAQVEYDNRELPWGYQSVGKLVPLKGSLQSGHDALLADSVTGKIYKGTGKFYYRLFLYPAIANKQDANAEGWKLLEDMTDTFTKKGVVELYQNWFSRGVDPTWERGKDRPKQAQDFKRVQM